MQHPDITEIQRTGYPIGMDEPTTIAECEGCGGDILDYEEYGYFQPYDVFLHDDDRCISTFIKASDWHQK